MSKFSKMSKSLSIAAATLLLAAPFTSQANSYDAAMDACISAFVAGVNLPKEQKVRVRKEEIAASPVSVHARTYKILVDAKGAESGKTLGRGTCIVDRGTVVSLNGKPVRPLLTAAR